MCLSGFLFHSLYLLQSSAASFRIAYGHVHNLFCCDILLIVRRELPLVLLDGAVLGEGSYSSPDLVAIHQELVDSRVALLGVRFFLFLVCHDPSSFL